MRLFILNKDQFSKHIYDLAKETGKYDEIYYLDDFSKDEDVKDFMSDFFLHINDETDFFVGFEYDDRRCEWFNKIMELGANIATIIAKSANVDPTARILPGCLIDENAVIKANCLIKTGCHIKPGQIVEENSIVERNGMSISHLSGH